MQRRDFLKTALVAPLAFGSIKSELNWQFRHGDRVCFIGDSITHRGLWHHYLETFYLTRFPKYNLTFINCGIGGDTTGSLLKRLDYDVLIHKPTVAVIMIGMNDSKNEYYQEQHTETELVAQRQQIIERYRADYQLLIEKLNAAGTQRLILVTPTPYDQTAQLERPVWFGKNDTLQLLAEEVRMLASQHQTLLVDFFKPLQQINLRVQKITPAFTLSGQDRVHPEALGHELMAVLFLQTQQFGVPSKNIEAQLNDTNSIDLSETPLPYPISNPTLAEFASLDFLTKQQLRFLHLNKTKYRIEANGSVIGDFSPKSLKKGITLDSWAIPTLQELSSKIQRLNLEKYELNTKLRDLRAAEVLFFDAKADVSNTQQRQKAIERMTNLRRKKLMQDYPMLLSQKADQKARIEQIERQIRTIQKQFSLTLRIFKV